MAEETSRTKIGEAEVALVAEYDGERYPIGTLKVPVYADVAAVASPSDAGPTGWFQNNRYVAHLSDPAAPTTSICGYRTEAQGPIHSLETTQPDVPWCGRCVAHVPMRYQQ